MISAPDERGTLAALGGDLRAAYLDQLPGARSAVLGRLWGALAREPLTGIAHRTAVGGVLHVVLADGRRLTGPLPASVPFGPAPASLTLDGVGYDHPARLMTALRLPGATDRYAVELDNSVANLALARASARPEPPRTGSRAASHSGPTPTVHPGPPPAWVQPRPAAHAAPHPAAHIPARDPLVVAEQSIVDGHPLHPACRARIGMSTADVLRYAPEHHPVVRLRVVEADPAHWLVSGVPIPPLLPVHPWQLDRVLASGLVRDTGREIPAHPLMSLRTLAPVDNPAIHIKTAMDVQMTSAVRTLSPAAVHNGPLMSQLLTDLGVPGLTVLRELSAASVLVDGNPDRGMAAVWREAPRPGTVLPLAALAELPALLTPAFLDALVDLLLPPLLTLLRLGVGLEAHGQNTLVRLAATDPTPPAGGSRTPGTATGPGWWPVEALYRDMGGVRVHGGRLADAGVAMPPLIGALPTDDPAEMRTTLSAALFGTVLPQLVAAAPQLDPGAFWRRVAGLVRHVLRDRPEDRDALLLEPVPVKATTAMRLAAEPLDEVWAWLPNPLSA
jgi:siderophore synthetase component